jgi:hypothetical protein
MRRVAAPAAFLYQDVSLFSTISVYGRTVKGMLAAPSGYRFSVRRLEYNKERMAE